MSETIYENQVLLGTFTGATTTSNVQVFTTPGTWIRPSNFTVARFEAWGGGGAGGSGGAPGATFAAGAGGGAYIEYWWDPITSPTKFPITGPLPVTVGLGGVASTDLQPVAVYGGDGGNSIISFGPTNIIAYGGTGSGGPSSPFGACGAGAGVLSAGVLNVGGNGGGGTGAGPPAPNQSGTIFGGGGGVLNATQAGGSIYGGGGGFGSFPTTQTSGALSVFGGPGGAGASPTVAAQPGKIPGGGGGGGNAGSSNPFRIGGNGGAGLVRITTY
jgi:hypothetical protein